MKNSIPISYHPIEQKLRADFFQKKIAEIEDPDYSYFPKSMNKQTFCESIKRFMENDLNIFLAKCMLVLDGLQQEDIQSLRSYPSTPKAQEFVSLFKFLEEKGFPSYQDIDRPVIFWSGKVAMDFSFCAKDKVSIRHFLSTHFMNALCHEMLLEFPDKKQEIYFFYFGISSIYSSFSSGSVDVYISSDKVSEPPGLHAGNFFWEAELPMINILFHNGIVQDIKFHFYDEKTRTWNSPVSFFSKQGENILVRRRHAHQIDPPHTHGLFLTDAMPSDHYEQWKQSDPRPCTTVGFLRKQGRHWKERAHHQSLKRMESGSPLSRE